MPFKHIPGGLRPGFNLTAASTLHHLVAAALVCAGLWGLLGATFNG